MIGNGKKINTILFSLLLLGIFLGLPNYHPVLANSQETLDAQITILQEEIDSIKEKIEGVESRIQDNTGRWRGIELGVEGASERFWEAPWWKKPQIGLQLVETGYDYFFGDVQKKWSEETYALQNVLEQYRHQQYEKELRIQELQAQKDGLSPDQFTNLINQHRTELAQHAQQTATRLAESKQTEYIRAYTCSWKNLNLGACILEGVAQMGNLMASLASYVTMFANSVFNVAAKISITDFYAYANMPAVMSSWSVVRDICNVFFIFVLLYIAISTILNVNGADVKKLLAKIIIVALLVNFSAIIPKVIIDVSNIFALQFYEQVNRIGGGDATSAIIKSFRLENVGLGVVKADGLGNFANGLGTIIVASYGKLFFFLITAFVLFAGAALFIVRTLVLLVLIITSPAYFLGMAVPFIGQHTGKWMEQLIKQALFAPVMMFLMLIILVFVAAPGNGLSNQLVASAGGIMSVQTLIYFILVNGMMIGAFLAASKMGAIGAGVAKGYGKKLGTWSTGKLVAAPTLGLTGALGRNTVGRLASRMSESKGLKDRATQGGLGGFAARMTLKATQKTAGSSFDVRSNKAIGGVTKGIGLGEAGGKGGYQAKLNNQVKAEEKFVKDSGFTEEQQRKYAESLENRGRFGAPVKWVGTPRKRQKAAEKIGDLKERRKVEAENAAIEERNRAAESSNQSLDLTVQQARNNAGYVAAKRQLEQEEQKLKQAEDDLRVALASGNQATIDNMKKAVETRRLMVEAAEKDFNKLEKPIKDLEATRKKPEEKKVYKRKEKPLKDQLKEVLKEEDDEKKKSSAGTPPPAPKTP